MPTGRMRDGSSSWRRGLFWSSVLLVGLLAFAVSSVLHIPIRLIAHHLPVPRTEERLSGNLRSGAADLGGGHRLTWAMDGWRSIRAAGAVADLRATGVRTGLTGTLTANLAGIAAEGISGTVAWPLFSALRPGLPVDCTLSARIIRLDLRSGWTGRTGDGAAEIEAGTCRSSADPDNAIAVPAMTARMTTNPEGMQVVLSRAADGTPLATGVITTDDRLRLTVLPAGAALVPGMPSTEASEIDIPLSLLGG